MFVTTESMRMQLPLPPGVHQWRAVEVELCISLLLVSMTQKETDSELPLPCTFLIQPEDLERLLVADQCTLDQVDLLSPPEINGTARWKLEPLEELWMCVEPEAAHARAWLFHVPNGIYADSIRQTPAAALRRQRRVFDAQHHAACEPTGDARSTI